LRGEASSLGVELVGDLRLDGVEAGGEGLEAHLLAVEHVAGPGERPAVGLGRAVARARVDEHVERALALQHGQEGDRRGDLPDHVAHLLPHAPLVSRRRRLLRAAPLLLRCQFSQLHLHTALYLPDKFLHQKEHSRLQRNKKVEKILSNSPIYLYILVPSTFDYFKLERFF